MRFLNEGNIVEYIGKVCNYKAMFHENPPHICTKDGDYTSFTSYIKGAKRLKSDEKLRG